MWHDHTFSQRNEATKRALEGEGNEVGKNFENRVGGWKKFEKRGGG